MKLIKNALKVLFKSNPSLVFINKEDKNDNACIVIIGLTAMAKQALPKEASDLITVSESEGYSVNYTEPYKSTNGKGVLYIGKQMNKTSEADLDNFAL